MPRGLRRFQESRQSHFVTFSCRQRRPYFATFELCDLFVQRLEDMRLQFDLRVFGYVVMPEHVHLLLSEPAEAKLSEALHYLKLSFSKRARSLWAAWSQVNAPNHPIMPKHGVLEIPTAGANLGHEQWGVSQVNAQKMGVNLGHRDAVIRQTGSFWEKRYYDRNVRDYREFTVKLRYLHRNPVKRGLVRSPEEWKWSSYRHYALRETGMILIESEWTARDRELRAQGGDGRIFLLPG